MASEIYDMTIIGGGPAGIFAGFYAGLRTAKTQLLESLPEMGGQVTALYPEKRILDVAGIPDVKGQALIDQQIAQLKDFPIDLKAGQQVLDVIPNEAGNFTIKTVSETTESKSVLIAVGNGAFNPRPLQAENVAEFEGTNVFYGVQNLAHFTDHDVMVAGGGDAAIDLALMLLEVAKSVTIVHRRENFRALEMSVQKMDDSAIKQQTPYLIQSLAKADNGRVAVTMKRVRSEDDFVTQTVDDIVVSYGFTSDNSVVEGWQIQPEREKRIIKVDRTMQTNIPGVYAIGDGVIYDGKQYLIATAYGEGPVAVNAIMQSLYPDRRGPVHSTSLKRDKD